MNKDLLPSAGGTSSPPKVFYNRYPEDKLNPVNVIPNNQLHSMSSKNLAYVILEDGSVVVGKNNQFQGHIDLARGKPVIAAGELSVVHGEIKHINNYSGHYRPSGIRAQKAAEDAFRKLGFNVDGKYIEKGFD